MSIKKIQASFNGGEYSPSLWARVDIDKYQTGLRLCRNFIIHPHGGISNRSGTKYVASTKYSDKKARLIPFTFSLDQSYSLEFGEGYIRFYTDGAQITLLSAAYEISSPYQEEDLPDLRFESSADTIYLTHPLYQTRILARYGNIDWRLSLYAPKDGPFMPENIENISLSTSAVSGTGITLHSSSSLFDPDHVGSLWRLRHYVQGQEDTVTFSSATTGTAIKCFTTWRLITHGTWTGKIKIEKSTDNGTTWTMLRSFSSANDFNANTFGTEDPEENEEPFLVRTNMFSYGSGSCNAQLTTDPFFQEGIVEATSYISATSIRVDVLRDVGSTNNTLNWSEGSWSEFRGWPRVCRFVQDRLGFGGTKSEPQNTWLSRTSNYTSFGRNIITLLDSDAISQPLPTRQLNAVNGLVVLQRLIAFTSASQWAIGASDNSPLTPTNAPQNIQGYNGSSGIDPVVIGNEAIFVQGRGTVVRNIGFKLQDDGFTGNRLNILAEHLFEGHQILEMAYQQEPDSIVWCLRDDGILLALTYMPEQEVVAWARHETEGEVESICVIPASGYDELWLTVKRGDSRFVERLSQRMISTDPKYQYFVDCGISYDHPIEITDITKAAATVQAGLLDIGFLSPDEPFLEGVTINAPIVVTAPGHGLSDGDLVVISDVVGMTELNGGRYKVSDASTDQLILKNETNELYVDGYTYHSYISGGILRGAYTTFSGLDHLEGKTVAILGDGNVFPQQVVTDGEITLSIACSIVQVGLPYTADMETLNVEVPLRSGTMQGSKVKISNVTFRLINSRGGYLGPNENKLYEAFNPTRLSLGSAPELFTGDTRQPLGAGYEDGGRVYFRQVDPLPVTISAIIPEVTPGGPSGR